MTVPDSPRPLVVAFGNTNRSDDGVGALVLELLARVGVAADLEWLGTPDPARLFALWRGRRHVVLVDAMVTGAPAASVHDMDLHTNPLPHAMNPSSSHGVGIAQCMELGRALGVLPPRVMLVGVEAAETTHGRALSRRARAGAARAATLIAARIAEAEACSGA